MAINLMTELEENAPALRIQDYFYVIAGIPKSGKTSLLAGIAKEYFGDLKKVLLLAFEKGYSALKIRAADIKDWDDFEEYVEQLIDDKEQLGIEIIGLDTLDVMYNMAEAKVLEEWNLKNPDKRTNDLGVVGSKGKSNSGYGVGHNLVEKKIRGQVDLLQKAGYGIFGITHSKEKKVEEKSGIEYDQLVLSLPSSAQKVFVNAADFIVFINIEKEKIKGSKELATKRYMYFRTDGFITAGGRFKNMPDRIEYSIKGFTDTVLHAIESEFDEDTDMKALAEKQDTKRQEKYNKVKEEKDDEEEEINELQETKDTIKAIVAGLSEKEKNKIKPILRKGIGTLDYISYDGELQPLKSVLESLQEQFGERE